MWSKAFLADLGERAVATVAQVVLAMLGADAVGVLTTGWQGVLLAALIGGLLSVLKSLAATRIGDPDTASLLLEADYVPDPGLEMFADEFEQEPYLEAVSLQTEPAEIPDQMDRVPPTQGGGDL